MNTISKLPAILALTLATIPTAHGKPWWKVMDIATMDVPARYGYHVSRTQREDEDRFVVKIDPAAGAVLKSASLRCESKPGVVLNMDIIEVNGQKQIEFTIPPDMLLPSSMLQLDSGPIKYCGPGRMDNFSGYSLRLDNIPRDTGSGFTFEPTARKIEDSFEFTYSIGMPQINLGLDPAQLRRVLSISLESSTGNRLCVPLPCASGGLEKSVKFILPRDQLENLVLVVEMTDQADFSTSRASKQFVGLGIIAANAEIAGALPAITTKAESHATGQSDGPDKKNPTPGSPKPISGQVQEIAEIPDGVITVIREKGLWKLKILSSTIGYNTSWSVDKITLKRNGSEVPVEPVPIISEFPAMQKSYLLLTLTDEMAKAGTLEIWASTHTNRGNSASHMVIDVAKLVK